MGTEMELAFEQVAGDLLQDRRTLQMKKYIQHGHVTTYDHCESVARLGFEMGRKLHLHPSERELVRGAMLHDYFLYDWHHYDGHLHGYSHPGTAAVNAERDFHITEKEKNIIANHMWPLTLFHVPTCREAWIVCVADKVCSLRETLFERG